MTMNLLVFAVAPLLLGLTAAIVVLIAERRNERTP
jgi:hypothetical protein